MGADTFFSQWASKDKLANAIGLPGAGKYQSYQFPQSRYDTGPYTGVTPTLAGANAGYQAGGPGSIPGAVNAPVRLPNSNLNVPTQNPYAAAARGAGGV